MLMSTPSRSDRHRQVGSEFQGRGGRQSVKTVCPALANAQLPQTVSPWMQLLRSIRACSIDVFLSHRPTQPNTGFVVELVVNPRPDSRIACFLTDGANFVRMSREQISEHLRAGGGKSRVVRWIARKIRHREERNDRSIKLTRTDVPIGELAVLAGDKCIEESG